MMSKYQKRHYEDIARIIRNLSTKNIPGDGIFVYKDSLIVDLCELFQEDNINFQSDKFIEACRMKQ